MNLQDLRGQKTVLTWSGGLDSTALIYYMIENYEVEIYPIFIDRGQRSLKQEYSSIVYFDKYFREKYSEKYHTFYKISTMIPPQEFRGKGAIKHTHALRNSDIINNAVRYALISGIKFILIGANMDDERDISSWDNNSKYLEIKNQEIKIGSGSDLDIVAPYLLLIWNKTDIIKWGNRKEIPLDQTRSCYSEKEQHCGECDACIKRNKAFLDAGVDDHTKYLNYEYLDRQRGFPTWSL